MADVGEIWHRARHDRDYREWLERDPAAALAGAGLTDDELALLDAALRTVRPSGLRALFADGPGPAIPADGPGPAIACAPVTPPDLSVESAQPDSSSSRGRSALDHLAAPAPGAAPAPRPSNPHDGPSPSSRKDPS
jgi:hypothetical protein